MRGSHLHVALDCKKKSQAKPLWEGPASRTGGEERRIMRKSTTPHWVYILATFFAPGYLVWLVILLPFRVAAIALDFVDEIKLDLRIRRLQRRNLKRWHR